MWGDIRQTLVSGLDLLLPPACLLCCQALRVDHNGFSLCDACMGNFHPLGPAHCSLCAQPFPGQSPDIHLCSKCLRKPPLFSTVHTLGSYQGSIKKAVQHLKYRNQLTLAKPLGLLLAEKLDDMTGDNRPDLLIPVPLHRKRLRQRGYNQAVELARPVARKLRLPLTTKLLKRIRQTPPQQGLSAEERRQNIRNAFDLTNTIQGQKILLLDDVMTTGETIRECCRILHLGGAGEIQIAVFGRA